MTTLYTGTSGFSYKEWKGPFYPEKLKNDEMLAFYSTQLPSVEINNTFYRMPKTEMLEKWRDTVPEDFRFVLKASRRITHQQRLKESDDSLDYLLKTSDVLGERRGPLLFQLPPFLKIDTERLESFLKLVPEGVRAAFEFRNDTWFTSEVYQTLERYGAALVTADTDQEGQSAPLERTADWGYLRLRRPGYDDKDLAEWAAKIRDLDWQVAYVFFKHEDEGAGPRMAKQFAELFAAP